MSEWRTRKIVRERSGGVCEAGAAVRGVDCRPGAAARATELSHRVGQGQGGPWCPANVLHMCTPHHLWCHREKPIARERYGWMLLRGEAYLEVPALVALWGMPTWARLEPDGGFNLN